MKQQHSNYETLRSWYLAKLRKSAIEAQVSGQLTPSALIAADREVIEKLIAERAESEEGQSKLRSKASSQAIIFAFFIWFYLIVGLYISLFLFCLTDASILADVFLVALNPLNMASSGSSMPNPIMILTVELVIYVYPLVALPLAFLSQRGKQ